MTFLIHTLIGSSHLQTSLMLRLRTLSASQPLAEAWLNTRHDFPSAADILPFKIPSHSNEKLRNSDKATDLPQQISEQVYKFYAFFE